MFNQMSEIIVNHSQYSDYYLNEDLENRTHC